MSQSAAELTVQDLRDMRRSFSRQELLDLIDRMFTDEHTALNMDVVVLSLVSGLAIDTLLMVNNYRDREQDAVSGKCTLVVRYGKKFGENMYLALGIAAVLLCFWFVYTGKLTPLEFIWAPCVYLYMHALTWRKMIQIGSGKKLNSILGETSRNMLFLGLLLAVALN